MEKTVILNDKEIMCLIETLEVDETILTSISESQQYKYEYASTVLGLLSKFRNLLRDDD